MGKLKNSFQSAQKKIFTLAHGVEERLFSASLSHYKPFTAAGTTGYYRAYRGSLTLDKPIGVLFYFDGDYTSLAFSHLARKSGLLMSQLTDVAARHNLLFVPVVAPFSLDPGYTTNWWKEPGDKGKWFKELYSKILGSSLIDSQRIWFAGYSGGAEFISYELLPSSRSSFAGASLIAGGGVNPIIRANSPALEGIPLTWHVGLQDDGVLAGWGWSALAAARSGVQYFEILGARCSLNILENQRHTNYPIARLVEDDLSRFMPESLPLI